MTTLTFSVGDDGVALISFDLAGRPMNVITPELQADLAAAVQRVNRDATIKGAVLTSAKPGHFIAGADLKDFVNAYEQGMTAARAAALMQDFHRITRAMETGGKAFAAALPGLALGGGLEIALACHYRVLSDDPKAVVGLPEVSVGLLPGGGGTQRLPRLIGVPAALQMMLTGTPAKPADALKLGIVSALAPVGELVAKAREWVLANPAPQQPWDRKGFKVPGGAGPGAPFAMQTFMGGVAQIRRQSGENLPAPLAIMSAVYEGTITGFDVGLRIESKYFGQLLSGPVARNLMRTMFVNKGAAEKLVRRPAGVPKSTVKKLGVLGAGMMGAGIAYSAALAGIEVVLIDATQAAAEKGKAYSETVLAKLLQKNATTAEKSAALLARITPTTDYALLAGCDLVVEAVFESREVKREVTQKAEAAIPATAIFASNTSTLTISSLAKTSQRPAQFIGLHFFSPVDRMPLLEVIVGEQTSQETLARALDFAAQLKKTPIVVNDSPGFFTSRVFGSFVDEGLVMLLEGVEPALIENAAKMAGMPVGPLAIADEVTLDLQLKVHEQAVADGLAPQFRRLLAMDVVHRMLAIHRGSRKAGGGFYDYPADAKKQLWKGLREVFPVSEVQPAVEELRERFLTIQALESTRCFEEGVIRHAADADLGSILGIGYPAWTGGTLSYVETVGIASFVATCERFAARYGERFKPSAALKRRAAENRGFYDGAQERAA